MRLPTHRPDRTVHRSLTVAARTSLLPLLLLVAACTNDSSPSSGRSPTEPIAPVMSYYPDAGVLTSSRDTCPWYDEAPELGLAFWELTDSALVSNPDSVFAADSAAVSDPDYWEDMMLLDPYTGAELFAGRCEVEWNRCNARCRRLPARTRAHLAARALCWSGCAARYALCKRREREREQDERGTGPYSCYGYRVIFDPVEPCNDGSYGGGGGSGGSEEGGSCKTEWIAIEINDGSGWRTYWEGWATVCE